MSMDEGVEDVAWKSFSWAIFGVIITILIFVFALIIAGYKERLTAVPPELQAELISVRFTNTADCFAFQDPHTGRVYPGVIDNSKFTEERMQRCYSTDQEHGQNDFNFRLQLGDKYITTNNYFNIDHFTITKKVIVADGRERHPETLTIFVQAGGRR